MATNHFVIFEIHCQNEGQFLTGSGHFRVFAECIFLYNCELWTMTKTINDSIDAFHRRQLRYALGIKYPRVITNHQLYDVTKWEPWSIVTERRRLSWLGHLMRLNPETPARQSFKEALRPVKRKPGSPPDDMDNNYSTRLIQERHTHKPS